MITQYTFELVSSLALDFFLSKALHHQAPYMLSWFSLAVHPLLPSLT